jgi:hypothetical protein
MKYALLSALLFSSTSFGASLPWNAYECKSMARAYDTTTNTPGATDEQTAVAGYVDLSNTGIVYFTHKIVGEVITTGIQIGVGSYPSSGKNFSDAMYFHFEPGSKFKSITDARFEAYEASLPESFLLGLRPFKLSGNTWIDLSVECHKL